MKTRDICVNDIQQGKIWRVVEATVDNWLDWTIEEAKRASKSDVIVHSGVAVGEDDIVYPVILTKHYEDGGEVYDIAELVDGNWIEEGDNAVSFKTDVYLSYISTLDHHEYQKGSFDNRPEHYASFQHYAPQIGRVGNLVPLPEKQRPPLPKKYTRMEPADLIDYLRQAIIEHKDMWLESVSKANRMSDKISDIIKYLMLDNKNWPLLKPLLKDSNSQVVGWMKWYLMDIYESECLDILVRLAQTDTLEGSGARIWLERNRPDMLR